MLHRTTQSLHIARQHPQTGSTDRKSPLHSRRPKATARQAQPLTTGPRRPHRMSPRGPHSLGRTSLARQLRDECRSRHCCGTLRGCSTRSVCNSCFCCMLSHRRRRMSPSAAPLGSPIQQEAQLRWSRHAPGITCAPATASMPLSLACRHSGSALHSAASARNAAATAFELDSSALALAPAAASDTTDPRRR